MELKRKTWMQVREYLEQCDSIIIPLGAVEQHGPGLPLGTDAIIAESLAAETGRRLDRMVGPVISPGMSLYPQKSPSVLYLYYSG